MVDPLCAAYKRPETMLEALVQSASAVPHREALERAAHATLARPRLPRIDGAERAKGQATCRQCRKPIPRGAWRIRLASFKEGQFTPLGYIHLACAKDYFETADIVEHVLHFSTALGDADREELRSALTSVYAGRGHPPPAVVSY